MAGLRVLPPAATSVVAPDFFSPSQIALGNECHLRLVLAGGKQAPRLLSHPAAEMGTAFHKLLEMSVRGQILREGELEKDLQRTLDALIDAADRRLAAQPTNGQPVKLRSVFPPLVWRRKVRKLIDTATRVYRPPGGSGPTTAVASSIAFNSLPRDGVWSEVPIRTPSLGLAGRMDLLTRSQGHSTIKDLKTGRVLDHEGSVLPKIQAQLRVYGVMFLELTGSQRVDLVVDDGAEHSVSFDLTIAAEVRSEVRELRAALPAGKRFPAGALATVGDWCGGCSFRHVCPKYRDIAPVLWSGSSFRLAPDTWGTVEKVTQSASVSKLTLRDDCGRRVHVFGLESGPATRYETGQKVWFFGLRHHPASQADGMYIHPVNFIASLPEAPRQSAWTLQVFRE
jgi:hypothetical protein